MRYYVLLKFNFLFFLHFIFIQKSIYAILLFFAIFSISTCLCFLASVSLLFRIDVSATIPLHISPVADFNQRFICLVVSRCACERSYGHTTRNVLRCMHSRD